MNNKEESNIILYKIIDAQNMISNALTINAESSVTKSYDYNIDHSLIRNSYDKIMHDGDIYLLEDDGMLRRIFDCFSSHNSLFITNNCNQNCIICSQPPEIANDYNHYFRINKSLIELISESPKSIGITGGEPTLLGHRMLNLLKLINTNHPNTTIHMLTNGLYYSKINNVRRLTEEGINNIVLGIPIYSHVHEVHNSIVKNTSYFQLLDALYNLASNDFNIELRIVISRSNYRDLPDLSIFIQKNLPFASHIAFMGLETIGNALNNIVECWITPTEYQIELEDSIHFLAANKFSVSIYNIPLCLLDKSLWQYSRDSISEWKKTNYSNCEKCSMKHNCSGIFSSGYPFYKNYINPII